VPIRHPFHPPLPRGIRAPTERPAPCKVNGIGARLLYPAAVPETEPLIRIENLGKTYGKKLFSKGFRALDGVSLEIEKSDYLAIMGRSGSGKSTMLNILGCLDRPTSGTVRVDGEDLFAKSDAELTRFRATTLGFIFQSFNLFDLLTAVENVEYPLHLGGVGRAERRKRALEALGWVGLEGKADRRSDRLSGGEKQRVAVARAIVSRPALVLADEPTANLDSHATEQLMELFVALNTRHNTTFVMATHDQRVMNYARRVIKMLDGKIADDIKQDPA